MTKNAQRLAAVLLTALFSLYCGEAAAQSGEAYPSRAVKIVVLFPAGGGNDILGRLFAQKLSERLRQPFIVENRTGASGIPGADYVAKSQPDGYTLLLANTSILAIQPNLFSKLPYDARRDFAPISIVAISPNVLVVHPSLPARDVKELVALAKANPGKLNYASVGNGTPFHLMGELFKARTGTDMVHVPYKGSPPALNDLISGRVQLMFNLVGDALPYIKSGKLRPLATTGSRRAALLPDLPTLAEAGLSGAESVAWFALVAPRDTPKAVIATLHAGIVNAVAQPDVQEKLIRLGFEPLGNSPEETATHARNENAKWAKVIKDSGARVDD